MRRVPAVVIALLLLVTVATAADRKRPDLEVTSLTGTPAKVVAGASFEVGTVVKNRGDARSQAWSVRFVMTRAGARTRIGTRTIPRLAPGAGSKKTTTLGATVAPGTWRLAACVHARCRVAGRTTVVVRRPSPTPPAPVTLTSPPDGAALTTREPVIAGGADPQGLVTVVFESGGTVVGSVSTQPQGDGGWSTPPASPLPDGAYTARAHQGDRISASRSFTIDATPPEVTIDHPAAGARTDLMAFDGKAGDGGAVTLSLADASGTTVQSPSSERNGGDWSALATPLDPGTYTLTAQQSDALGNTGQAVAKFTVPFTLLAAGDIAGCDTDGDTATALILAQRAGTIATLGDNAYESPGVDNPFTACFDPSWGPFKPRIMPTPGNHEYMQSAGATQYFSYFGTAAGAPGAGFYSYDVGDWHVIALNTNGNCAQISCAAGSPQETWLRADLAAHASAKCTLAYFHHPRFSTYLGPNSNITPLWQALYDGGADLVLNGHAHNYERFAAQDPAASLDPTTGITQIIAGTGGRSHQLLGAQPVAANSLVRDDQTFGILDLTLEPGGWSWRFLPAAGATFTDSGSADCH
jgi:hypothetical protein